MYRFFVKLTFLFPAIVISQGNEKDSKLGGCSARARAGYANIALEKFVKLPVVTFLGGEHLEISHSVRAESEKTIIKRLPRDSVGGLF